MSTSTYEIVILGDYRSGKTDFIRSVSNLKAGDIQQATSYDNSVVNIKYHNRWELISGRITFDDKLYLNLVGIPGPLRFDAYKPEKDATILGYVVIIDSAEPGGASKLILQTARVFHNVYGFPPYVAIASKQNHPDAWSIQDLRILLDFSRNETFIPCNTKDKESVKNVLLQLLYRVQSQIGK